MRKKIKLKKKSFNGLCCLTLHSFGVTTLLIHVMYRGMSDVKAFHLGNSGWSLRFQGIMCLDNNGFLDVTTEELTWPWIG